MMRRHLLKTLGTVALPWVVLALLALGIGVVLVYYAVNTPLPIRAEFP